MDEETPSLDDFIKEHDHNSPTSTDVEIAEEILEEALAWSAEKAIALLLSLLTDQVRRVRRRAAREAEQESGLDDLVSDEGTDEGQGSSDTESALILASVLDGLRSLRNIQFKVPVQGQKHGDTVTWGEATPPQHRTRGDATMKQVRSLATDAERHYAVADLLDDRGVACLNDLLDDNE